MNKTIEQLAIALIRARRSKIKAKAARNRILREGCEGCGGNDENATNCPKRFTSAPSCPVFDSAHPHHLEYRSRSCKAASLLRQLDRAVAKVLP